MEKIKASQLKIGQSMLITKLNVEDRALRRHLFDMGVTSKCVITLIKIAPLGDPYLIKLRGYSLSLRKSDLDKIEGVLIVNKEEQENIM